MSQEEYYDDLIKRSSTFTGMAFRQTFGIATIYTDLIRRKPEDPETYLSLLDGIYTYGGYLAGDQELITNIVTHDVEAERKCKTIAPLGEIVRSTVDSRESICSTRNLEITLDFHAELEEFVPTSIYYLEQMMIKAIGIATVVSKEATNISITARLEAVTEDSMLHFAIGYILDDNHKEVIDNITKVEQCGVRLWQQLMQIPLSGMELEIIRLLALKMGGEMELSIVGEQATLNVMIPEKAFTK